MQTDFAAAGPRRQHARRLAKSGARRSRDASDVLRKAAVPATGLPALATGGDMAGDRRQPHCPSPDTETQRKIRGG